jgi:hypothetical protein
MRNAVPQRNDAQRRAAPHRAPPGVAHGAEVQRALAKPANVHTSYLNKLPAAFKGG